MNNLLLFLKYFNAEINKLNDIYNKILNKTHFLYFLINLFKSLYFLRLLNNL